MTNGLKRKALLIFVVGLFIRLVLMVYTSHAANFENIQLTEMLYSYGFVMHPFLEVVSYGTGFYILFWPSYLPFLVFNYFGIYYEFLVDFFIKIPSLIGDIITFYALYEISLHVSKDEKKSLIIAAVAFLNPYSIWLTSVISHPSSAIAAFILLSYLFLLRKRPSYSAICLVFSMSIQFLPVFLTPAFLVYLWQESQVNIRGKGSGALRALYGFFSNPDVKHFIVTFLVSGLILFSPYIIAVAIFYFADPQLLWMYLTRFSSPVVSELLPGDTLFDSAFNFTGIISSLGFSVYFSPFLGYKPLIVAYLVLLGFIVRQKLPLIQQLNRSVILFFSLFILMIPLSQGHYLGWFLPFIIIEALLFSGLPYYYPFALSILHFVIEPIVGYNFRWYFPTTLPFLFPDRDIARGNAQLQLSISGVYGFFLVLTVIYSLSQKHDYKSQKFSFTAFKSFKGGFVMLFLASWVLEIIGVGYELKEAFYIGEGGLFVTMILLFLYLYRSRRERLRGPPMISSLLSKALLLTNILGMILLFSLLAFKGLNYFALIAQTLISLGLLILNSKSAFVPSVLTFSFIFVVIYLIQISLNTKDGLITFVAFLNSFSLLLLQTRVDRALS